MQLTLRIIGLWMLLSFTLGPCLTWAFFYPERRARAARADHDRWIATHSTTSRALMPEWLRWEDTSEPASLYRAGARHS